MIEEIIWSRSIFLFLKEKKLFKKEKEKLLKKKEKRLTNAIILYISSFNLFEYKVEFNLLKHPEVTLTILILPCEPRKGCFPLILILIYI
jgi:hypothetical protein